MVKAIERTQEVSLLALSIQGIKEERQSREVLGTSIPGTSEVLFVQYSFTGKLGLDGSKVQIRRSGENGYRIDVPEFDFIGYAEPEFEVAVEDGGVLSWVTPDIDQLDLVNEIQSEEAQQQYLDQHEEFLREQTEVFYDRLITSIDPAAGTTYEFS